MSPSARKPVVETQCPSLQLVIDILTEHFQDRIGAWWPFETTFEIIVGAFLTQNTNWKNAEKAINNLKMSHLLSLKMLADSDKTELIEACIKPAGYFHQKTKNLQAFAQHILGLHHSIETYLTQDTLLLRDDLLSQRGVGPETADTILLYAGGHSSFVVDAYTIRVLSRLGLNEDAKYSTIQQFFEETIAPNREIYKEVHAAFVEHAKTYCKKTAPLCLSCPLHQYCSYSKKMRRL